jgi:hypothetical protein
MLNEGFRSLWELMSNPRFTAVCSALFVGILAPVTVKWLDRRIESEGFAKISSKRASMVSGLWVGNGNDNYVSEGNQFLPFNLRLEIALKGKSVIGKASLEPELKDLNPVNLDMSGGFYDTDFLQLTYKSSNRARKQLGAILLRLSAECDELDGYYAGFSPAREAFVTGTLHLRKVLS